jgi:hypothetical protein
MAAAAARIAASSRRAMLPTSLRPRRCWACPLEGVDSPTATKARGNNRSGMPEPRLNTLLSLMVHSAVQAIGPCELKADTGCNHYAFISPIRCKEETWQRRQFGFQICRVPKSRTGQARRSGSRLLTPAKVCASLTSRMRRLRSLVVGRWPDGGDARRPRPSAATGLPSGGSRRHPLGLPSRAR